MERACHSACLDKERGDGGALAKGGLTDNRENNEARHTHFPLSLAGEGGECGAIASTSRVRGLKSV